MDDSSIPATMRVWSYNRRGQPREVLKLDSDRSIPPQPQRDQVLVRVHYVGMNPSFAGIVMRLPNPRGREMVAEIEYSGTVVALGPDANGRLSKGQSVFGALDDQKHILSGAGVMQDFLLLDADEVYPIPKELTIIEAAGLSCAGQTALNMIQTAKVVKGSKVFVNGASGGVGMFCLQICKAVGAYVVASCSEQTQQLVESLKPDEVVDYRAHHPLADYLAQEYHSKPFDVILDAIGIQELYVHSPKFLKVNGIYANAGSYSGIINTIFSAVKNYCWPRLLGGTPRKWIMIRTPLDRTKMERLIQLVEDGSIKVPIDSAWDVNEDEDQIYKAYDRILSQRAKGKIIIKLIQD